MTFLGNYRTKEWMKVVTNTVPRWTLSNKTESGIWIRPNHDKQLWDTLKKTVLRFSFLAQHFPPPELCWYFYAAQRQNENHNPRWVVFPFFFLDDSEHFLADKKYYTKRVLPPTTTIKTGASWNIIQIMLVFLPPGQTELKWRHTLA